MSSEIATGIERFREGVDAHRDAHGDPAALRRGPAELERVAAGLRSQAHLAAALVVEELRATAEALSAGEDDPSGTLARALSGAALQLADHAAQLARGESDPPMLLLPLINELRVARGVAVVTPGQQLARVLSAREPDTAEAGAEGDGAEAARRRLGAYEAALLPVLREREPAAALARLQEIAEAMAAATGQPRGRRLFEAAAALLEALTGTGRAPSLEARRLLGRLGQQLKRAAEQGEAALAEVPDDLCYGLIHELARAGGDGPRIRALRAAYDLDALLPDETELARRRARLRGPDTGLAPRLARLIATDLASLQACAEAWQRDEAPDPERVDAALEAAERGARRLAGVGLTMLERMVANQTATAAGLAERRARDDAAWAGVGRAMDAVGISLERVLPAGEPGWQPVDTTRGPAAERAGADDEPGMQGRLLPLVALAALLPRATVRASQPLEAVRVAMEGPAWMLGFGIWHDRELPVISLEAMVGGAVPPRSRDARVVVVNSQGDNLDNAMFMVVTQGEPEPNAYNMATFLQRLPARPEDAGVARMRLSLAAGETLVPDLAAIERAIGEALAGMGAAGLDDWEIGASLGLDL